MAKCFRLGNKSPTLFTKKKTLCRGNLLVKCKIVIIKPVLGKKLKKTKSTFIAGLWNFYLYFLEIETQEIAGKKIKVALPEHCAIKS